MTYQWSDNNIYHFGLACVLGKITKLDTFSKRKWTIQKIVIETVHHTHKKTIWREKKELHLKPKYVWNCKLHLNDDCNFYSWPFDIFFSFFCCQLFEILHIFFLVICSNRSFFLSWITLKKTIGMRAKKDRRKLQIARRKSLTVLWSPQESFLRQHFIVEWINHTNDHNGLKQMSNSF